MFTTFHRRSLAVLLLGLAFAVLPGLTFATHSWGGYHWANALNPITNPFTLKLGDNVSSAWKPSGGENYLATASTDWSKSSAYPHVLYTQIVAGGTRPKPCKPTPGQVEVCSASYGNTGWLGVAQIWVSGCHITQGTVKLNDTYFNTPTYNSPAWR